MHFIFIALLLLPVLLPVLLYRGWRQHLHQQTRGHASQASYRALSLHLHLHRRGAQQRQQQQLQERERQVYCRSSCCAPAART